jgi:hypothetical protein
MPLEVYVVASIGALKKVEPIEESIEAVAIIVASAVYKNVYAQRECSRGSTRAFRHIVVEPRQVQPARSLSSRHEMAGRAFSEAELVHAERQKRWQRTGGRRLHRKNHA